MPPNPNSDNCFIFRYLGISSFADNAAREGKLEKIGNLFWKNFEIKNKAR